VLAPAALEKTRVMVLQKFRDRLTGIMAIFILGLLAVPFALVGVNSYFAPDTDNNVAIVNDEGITLSEFNTSFQNYRERMRSLMGQSFDAAQFDGPVIRRQHLETMIESRKRTVGRRPVSCPVDS
jgi:peptidyl-prolyl cis-trans isomerase D